MTFTRLATGDALTVLRQLPDEFVHSCVTSPSYWKQRDYEADGQIGLEATPEEYLDRLLAVFDEVWRVLRRDGTCWVVLGDTYVGKCLALIPGRFGAGMTARQWICRNRIIWHKPNVLPASAADRFTVDFEELLFFVKDRRYFFEQQFVPYKALTTKRIRQFARNGERFDGARHKSYHGQGSVAVLERLVHKNLHVPGRSVHSMHRKRANGEGEPAMRAQGANMRAVWTIPVGRCRELHFAAYPEGLVEIAVRAGCPEGGIVLDPFSGSGTTGIVCERLGRSYLGIELNAAYVELSKRRIRGARSAGCKARDDVDVPRPSGGDPPSCPPRSPVALSFFSGALGLDLGIEEAGLGARLACETDPDARATIRANRPGLPLLDDIHECTAARVRAAAGVGDADIDVVFGGAPCQSFSSAGSRRGLDDVRGVAVLKLVSLAVELRARYVVVENVRGILSAGGGRVMEKMLRILRDDGYAVSFRLYDAAYFGAPQRRERVVVIGCRSGSRVPYLTPTHSDRPADGLPSLRTLRDAIGDMAGTAHHHAEFPERRLAFFRKLKAGEDWRDLSKEDQEAALSEAARDAAGGKTGFYRRLAWDKPCPTLVTMPNMPATDLCHPEEVRPLSVEEYARIQGFPDGWRLCGDVESRYRQLGNAVPVPLGRAVGRTILEHMRTGSPDDPAPGFRYSRYRGTSDREWPGTKVPSGCPLQGSRRPGRADAADEIPETAGKRLSSGWIGLARRGDSP